MNTMNKLNKMTNDEVLDVKHWFYLNKLKPANKPANEMNMYLNKTLSGSFEPAVLSLLRSKQCPMRVYREIWKYIPHSDKPKMVNLKDQILEHIMCPHPNPRVASLMKHVGGPTKLIETMRKFSNDNEYRRRLITMGPYLKLRAKLRNMGMM